MRQRMLFYALTLAASLLFVCVLELVLRGHSPDSLVGSALLFEHLHPRVFGEFGGVQPYLLLAGILKDQGKAIELREVLLHSLSVEPTILACRALGDFSLRYRRPSDALPYYHHTFDFWQSEQERVENGHLLAETLSRAGRLEESRGELQRVLQLQPDYAPALRLQQALLGEDQ